MKSSLSQNITMVMLSYIIAASCFLENCKKASMGPYSIVRSDISLKSCSSAGQVNAIPSSINAYGRKDAGYSLSAALAAVVLSLPEVTKATASPLGVDKDGYFECKSYHLYLSRHDSYLYIIYNISLIVILCVSSRLYSQLFSTSRHLLSLYHYYSQLI